MTPEEKAAAEAANQEIARSWAQGLGLVYAGVDLADTLEYSLLTVLGHIQLQEAGFKNV